MIKFDNLKFVRPNDLAEKLGVSRVTLWRWEKDGILPPKTVLGSNTKGRGRGRGSGRVGVGVVVGYG